MAGAPILVGVDGSTASLSAVELAVREATLRRLPLRIVHVDEWAHHPAWAGTPTSALDDPKQILRAAADRALAHASTAVETDVLAGHPAAALIEASASATLAVVGHRGHGGFPGLLLGSVAAALAGHARCPTLVVRHGPPEAGTVVVGIDGSPATDVAVGFAFTEAELRHAPLLALHTWAGPDILGPTDLLIYDAAAEHRAQIRRVESALEHWHARHPDVRYGWRACRGRPAHALIQASASAELVVVGVRGHGGLPGQRLGSIPHALLHHAGCPVAAVPATTDPG